jgi:hypothetical protein
MRLLIAREPEVHYAQVRPMRATRTAYPLFPLTMDCSESAYALLHWVGCDIGKAGYRDGQGNTGTLYSTLPHYFDPALAQVGALVDFGPPTMPLSRQHVCMVLDPDAHDPWLFSHGQERGPLKIRLSVERQFHSGPVTFLSIAAL